MRWMFSLTTLPLQLSEVASATHWMGGCVGLSETFGTFLTIEKFLAPAGRRIPDRRGRSSVNVQNINVVFIYNLKSCLPFFMNMIVCESHCHLLPWNSLGLNSLCCVRSVVTLLPPRLGFFCINFFFRVRAVVWRDIKPSALSCQYIF